MKIFLFLLGIVAAGIVGYSFEPQMRQSLTGKGPEKKMPEGVRTVTVEIGAPKQTIDASTWPVEQLPKKVQLKVDVEIANDTGDIKMTIPAGNRVDLVRIEGQTLIVSPGPGPFQGSVPVIQTDLLDQLAVLAKNPPAANPEPAPVDPAAIVANNPEVPESTEPAPEVAVVYPEVIPPAEPIGDVTPAPVEPEIAANDTPAADLPAEEPEPEPAPATGSSDVVGIMQASIKAGDIKEFTFDQVLEWTASEGLETIDGESSQTGLASYKAETVFGVKTIQAKAIIKDGKVVRWLWPKSGMEIK